MTVSLIRSLIISDVRANAEAIAVAMERCGDQELQAIAAQPDEAVTAARTHAVDVGVIDLPPAAGIRLAHVWNMACPAVGVVAYGLKEDERLIRAWIDAGAVGCVRRDASLEDLLAAVRAAAPERSRWFAGPVRIGPSPIAPIRAANGRGGQLTHREAEVLRLVAAGLSNREIAETLCVQLPTVKNHVRHVLRKLGVRSRVEAAFYLRYSLPTPPDRLYESEVK